MSDFNLEQNLRAYLRQRPSEESGPAFLWRYGNLYGGLAWEVDETIHRDTANWCAERLSKGEFFWVCIQYGDGPQQAVLDLDQAAEVGRIQDPEERFEAYMRFWADNKRRNVYYIIVAPGDMPRMIEFGAQRPFETLTRAMPTLDTPQPVYRFRAAQSVFQRARQLLSA